MAEYIERKAAMREIDHARTLTLAYLQVATLPAADVSPVVHGRWILRNTCGSNTEKYHCSVCDKIPRSLYPENFCPNCGAKMDGEC